MSSYDVRKKLRDEYIAQDAGMDVQFQVLNNTHTYVPTRLCMLLLMVAWMYSLWYCTICSNLKYTYMLVIMVVWLYI